MLHQHGGCPDGGCAHQDTPNMTMSPCAECLRSFCSHWGLGQPNPGSSELSSSRSRSLHPGFYPLLVRARRNDLYRAEVKWKQHREVPSGEHRGPSVPSHLPALLLCQQGSNYLLDCIFMFFSCFLSSATWGRTIRVAIAMKGWLLNLWDSFS